LAQLKFCPDFILEDTIRAAIHASVRSMNLDHVTSRWKSSECVNRCVNECTPWEWLSRSFSWHRRTLPPVHPLLKWTNERSMFILR